MTLSKMCFSIAKKIKGFDFIDEFHEITYQLSQEQDYCNYVDFANHIGLQAYPFLLIVNNIDQYSKMHDTKYKQLKSNTIAILEKVHLMISEFNRKVINRSFGSDLLVKDILTIYDHKKHNIKIDAEKYYNSDIFNDLITEFTNSAQMQYLIKNKDKIDSTSFVAIKDLVFSLEKELEEVPPWETPEEINRIVQYKDNDKIKLSLSAVFIRAQLKIINQILFQAFFSPDGKLFSIDAKNTYDKRNDQSTIVGRGFKVNIIDHDLFTNKFNNFVVYKDTEKGNTEWALIAPSMQINIDQDFGLTHEYQLRLLDYETLNPYFNLVNMVFG